MSIHQRLWLRAFPIFVRLFLSAANISLFPPNSLAQISLHFLWPLLPFENFNWTRQRFRLLPSLDGFIKSKVDFIKCAVKLNVLPIKFEMTARHLLDTFSEGQVGCCWRIACRRRGIVYYFSSRSVFVKSLWRDLWYIFFQKIKRVGQLILDETNKVFDGFLLSLISWCPLPGSPDALRSGKVLLEKSKICFFKQINAA